jgi:hypothetical protein
MLQRGLISSKGPILLLLCKPSLIGVGSSRVPMLLQDRRKSCARRYLVGIVMNHHAQLLICPSSATVLANADADVEQHTMYVHTCFVRALRCSDPGDRSRSLYWIDKLPLTRSCLFFPGGSAAANPFLGQQHPPPQHRHHKLDLHRHSCKRALCNLDCGGACGHVIIMRCRRLRFADLHFDLPWPPDEAGRACEPAKKPRPTLLSGHF